MIAAAPKTIRGSIGDHRRDARRHRALEIWQAFSRALFRRRDRRSARGVLRRRRRDERVAPGVRDLLDVPAARLRSDRPRRRRAESTGRLLHGSRRLRRRRRSDAHGPLRYRVPAHAAEHDADGAAQRRRTASRCSSTRCARRPGRRSAIRAARRAGNTTTRSRRSCRARPKCCAAAAGSRSSRYGNTVDIALDAYDLLRDGEGGRRRQLPTVVNARFAKPLDEALLLELERDTRPRHHARRALARRPDSVRRSRSSFPIAD